MGISEKLTNQQKLDFIPDALISGGASMKGGKSIQDQIAQAPVDAFHAPTIQWPGYKTSMAQQAAFHAQALARIEATQAVQNGLFRQILDVLQTLTPGGAGVTFEVDYARLEAAVDKAVAQSLPDSFPEYEITKKETAK